METSACAQAGALAHRAGPLERAAASFCREAGARVAASTALRDMKVDMPASDARRIAVVANRLPIWRGVQVAVDTTLVSPIQRSGQARAKCDTVPGLAFQQAAARKRRTYPEFRPDRRGRCRLVVFGLNGRTLRSRGKGAWFLAAEAERGLRGARGAAGRARVRRWTGLVSLAALRAHAATVLELPAVDDAQ